MKYEIKNRWTGIIQFLVEADSLKLAVEAAIKSGANLVGANLDGANMDGADLNGANLRRAGLTGADLTGADLTGAILRGANMDGANLTGANLTGADLTGADLTGAILRGANLDGANMDGADLNGANLRRAGLTGANLRSANLRSANLRDANLAGANLEGANLTGADLRDADLEGAILAGANLTIIRDDIWAVLSAAPREVPALRAAIFEGRINGSTYEGECACLVGTIAKAKGCHHDNIGGLKPDSSRPAERFFLAIKKGDTPENSQASKLALEWVDQWLTNMREAFSTSTKPI